MSAPDTGDRNSHGPPAFAKPAARKAGVPDPRKQLREKRRILRRREQDSNVWSLSGTDGLPLPRPAHPQETSGFSHGKANSRETLARCWRKGDSNRQSRPKGDGVPANGYKAAAEERWIPIITKSARGELSLQRRPPLAPRRRLVVGVREAQHGRVVKTLADDLERQRQAAVGITAALRIAWS